MNCPTHVDTTLQFRVQPQLSSVPGGCHAHVRQYSSYARNPTGHRRHYMWSPAHRRAMCTTLYDPHEVVEISQQPASSMSCPGARRSDAQLEVEQCHLREATGVSL
jgi:hypothetical protein